MAEIYGGNPYEQSGPVAPVMLLLRITEPQSIVVKGSADRTVQILFAKDLVNGVSIIPVLNFPVGIGGEHETIGLPPVYASDVL